MKRNWILLGLGLFSLAASAENRAVDVRFIRAGAFFDTAGYQVVRLVAAGLLAEDKVEKFVIVHPVAQSARGFCLELSRNHEAAELDQILTLFKKVNAGVGYEVNPTASCE